MSRSLNKVMLIGNLGADPEVRSTASGTRVATLSLATSRSWTNQSGERQEKTEWHRVVCWDKLGEIAERYLKKGDRIWVEGRIEYTDRTLSPPRYVLAGPEDELVFELPELDDITRLDIAGPQRLFTDEPFAPASGQLFRLDVEAGERLADQTELRGCLHGDLLRGLQRGRVGGELAVRELRSVGRDHPTGQEPGNGVPCGPLFEVAVQDQDRQPVGGWFAPGAGLQAQAPRPWDIEFLHQASKR